MMKDSSSKHGPLSEDLISLAPDCIVTLDLKGIVTSFSTLAPEITGYSEDELTGKHFSQLGFLRAKDIPEYERIFQSLLKGKKPEPFEVTWHRKDGTQFSAKIQIDFIKKDNKIVGFQANTKDITEIKLMKKTLKEIEGKFKQFFEKYPDYCYIVSPDGKIIDVNQSALSIMGYKKEEIVGKPVVTTVYAPSSVSKAKTLFEKWKKTGTLTNEELNIVTKTGEERQVLLSVDAVKDSNGNLLHSISVQRDITDRKQAEKALQESEKRYHTLFEKSPISITLLSKYGIILDMNKATEDLIGFSRKKIIGKPFDKLLTLDPEDLPKLKSIFEKLSKGIEVSPYELEIKRKDGETRFIYVVNSLLMKDDEIIGFQIISTDITEKRKVEETLRESEEKFRTLTENVNVGVYRNTPGANGKFIEANPAIVEMFGYESKEEFLKQKVIDLYQSPENRREFIKTIQEKGSVQNEELLLKKKDGTSFIGSVSAVAVINEEGEIKHYDGIIEDITARKEMEEALRRSEEKYRTILENIEDGYFEVDIAGNFTFFNDSLCRILGYPREELMGMNNREYMNEETAQSVYKTFNTVFRTGTPTRAFDWEIRRKNGTKRYVEASISLIFGPSREPTGFRGIVRDITERKKAEEKIRKLNLDLKKRIDERSRRIEVLLNARQNLQVEKNWEKGFREIVETMSKLGFDQVGIFLVNRESDGLSFHFGKGISLPKIDTSVPLSKKEYFGVQCVLEKKTIHMKNAESVEGKQIGPGSDSFAWVPIMVQDEVFAALAIGSFDDSDPITEEDVKDLEILASMSGNFIDRTRMLVEPVAEKKASTEMKHWIDSSEGYIVLERKPEKSFRIFYDLVTHGIPGFIISREHPDKIKKKYNLYRTPLLWLSRTEIENTLSPDDLPKLSYILKDFTRKCKESVVLLDGLEYLILQTDFKTVMRHLQELKDITAINRSRLIMPLHKGAILSIEFGILEREFSLISE